MIGEQLQGNRVDDGRQNIRSTRHVHHLAVAIVLEAGGLVGKHKQLAAPCAYFRQIAFELAQQLIVGRHGDDWHLFIHQCQRAMFQFAGRIRFGVDVGDLLQLQRAFLCHGILNAASKKQRVMLVHQALGDRLDLFVQKQGACHKTRERIEVPNVLLLRLVTHARAPRQHQRQQQQCTQLRGECLGGRHADLTPGGGQQTEVRLAHE